TRAPGQPRPRSRARVFAFRDRPAEDRHRGATRPEAAARDAHSRREAARSALTQPHESPGTPPRTAHKALRPERRSDEPSAGPWTHRSKQSMTRLPRLCVESGTSYVLPEMQDQLKSPARRLCAALSPRETRPPGVLTL